MPPPRLHIPFSQPAACLDQLNHIDDLLAHTDGCTQPGQDPRDGAVHLVCTGGLKGAGAPGVKEEGAGNGMGRGAGLGGGGDDGGVSVIGVWVDGEEGGGEEWGGEGEEVE
jgi:hypothetical protein